MFQISFHVLLFCFIKTGGCENTWFIPVCVRPDSAFFFDFQELSRSYSTFLFHLCSSKIFYRIQCRHSRVSCKISSLVLEKLFSVELLEVRVIVVQSE